MSDQCDARVPTALESEQALCGALVCGKHVSEIRRLVSPEQFWRTDHRRIATAAYGLDDRGVEPDAALIAAGTPLDSPAYIYQVADYSIGLTPDKIAEHARRLHAAHLARQYLALFARASTTLRENPAAALNGFPTELTGNLEALRAGMPADTRLSETLSELAVRLAEQAQRDMLVDDLFALGEIAMLHGQPRDGKTWIALEIALALAVQAPVFGLSRFAVSKSRRTLIISNEDSPAAYLRRLELLCAGHGLSHLPDGILLLVGRGVSLDDPAWQHRLIDETRQEQINNVVIDPLRSVTMFADQGPADLRPVAQFLRRLIGETGAGVLVVHHDTKPQPGTVDTRRRAQRASGGGLFSIVDAPVHVERAGEHQSLMTPDGFKHADDPAPVLVVREVGDGYVRLIGETAAGKTAADVALDAAVLDHLRQSGGGSGRAIAATLRRRRDDVLQALERLQTAGIVDSVAGPRRAQLWCLR